MLSLSCVLLKATVYQRFPDDLVKDAAAQQVKGWELSF